MEYPIIDTLTDAYIRNGWTGLEVKTGKNIFTCYDGQVIESNGVRLELNGHSVNISGTATANFNVNLTFGTGQPAGSLLENNEYYTWSAFTDGIISSDLRFYGGYLGTSTRQTTMITLQNSATLLVPETGIYNDRVWISIHTGDIYDGTLYIQTEKGRTATPFEPYGPPSTDMFSRTRLPLIRYIPHPVIDSLQRAAAGTMTADDVQVLRHYLTKFGIGNIELGRFHAINPNVSDDIREIDLEPILIDEPIKEKKTGEEDLNGKTE